MNEFTSEVLPSGIKITVTAVGKYKLEDSQGEFGYISKQDIARMYGIAFPAKRHPGTCCINAASPEVDDINVADLQLTEPGDKYEQRVKEMAREIAIAHNRKVGAVEELRVTYQDRLDDARIAIAAVAEGIRQSWIFSYAYVGGSLDVYMTICERYLIGNGYVPAPINSQY